MEKHYINLTNGIEKLPDLMRDGTPFSFIRIQSTVCEQKDWSRLILDLDNDLLLHAAMGVTCYVYDFGAQKKTARAIYQGLEFVRYALSRALTGDAPDPIVRGHNCREYFYESYKALSSRALGKLKYYRSYMKGSINIIGVSTATVHDNDRQFYLDILQDFYQDK